MLGGLMVTIHALYEQRQQHERFDMDYLVSKRIPFVREVLQPYGLVDIVVHKGIKPPGLEILPRFVCIIVLTFSSTDGFLRGWNEQSERLNAGIAEFTNIAPMVQISEVL
jgi:hypothetical protein